jgi:TolB-like protein
MKSKSILTIFLVLALVVVGYFLILKSSTSSKPAEKSINMLPFKAEKSIAVLPFKNESPDQENTYFLNGIMDEVLKNLQKIVDLRVISRSSVEPYRKTTKSISEIAKELGIVYILEGSGQKNGNSFRLNVQLTDARSDKHMWSSSYEQEINTTSDIMVIQSQTGQTIASEIKGLVMP